MKIALKTTPQRSNQYTQMTVALARPELIASPVSRLFDDVQSVDLARHHYLVASVQPEFKTTSWTWPILSRLGASSELYEYFDHIGDVAGPLLRPVEPQWTPFLPPEMSEVRRYKGKTNEVFTRVLLNVALFAGKFATHYNERLRILDPLVGGGTTLFVALAAGYDAFGIELSRQDVESTVGFVRQFFEGEQIPFREIDERRRLGRRYIFDLYPKGNTRHLVLVHGDSREATLHLREVPGGPRFHAIVGDLPYGIQHAAQVAELLDEALPVWESLLLPGGSIALAWNATRIERREFVELFGRRSRLQIYNEAPYTGFEHVVDRVIKRRDILVAVKA